MFFFFWHKKVSDNYVQCIWGRNNWKWYEGVIEIVVIERRPLTLFTQRTLSYDVLCVVGGESQGTRSWDLDTGATQSNISYQPCSDTIKIKSFWNKALPIVKWVILLTCSSPRPRQAQGRSRRGRRKRWWLWHPQSNGSTSSSLTAGRPHQTSWNLKSEKNYYFH